VSSAQLAQQGNSLHTAAQQVNQPGLHMYAHTSDKAALLCLKESLRSAALFIRKAVHVLAPCARQSNTIKIWLTVS